MSSVATHSIRLIGPWQVEWIDPPGEPSSTVKMPAEWSSLFGNRAGTVRFTRMFHRPTNLDAGERVWIEFTGVGGGGEVRVNGVVVGTIELGANSARFEITVQLQPRNELVVELMFNPKASSAPGGLHEAVALRIESEGD
jgi:hypothetical protein